jgi:ankyrin repeat protein
MTFKTIDALSVQPETKSRFPSSRPLLDKKYSSEATHLLLRGVIQDRPNEVKEALSSGADPNVKNHAGDPAIILAVHSRSKENLGLLLAHPDIDRVQTDMHGLSAEDHARGKGLDEFVALIRGGR